jgi:hypothetical protein
MGVGREKSRFEEVLLKGQKLSSKTQSLLVLSDRTAASQVAPAESQTRTEAIEQHLGRPEHEVLHSYETRSSRGSRHEVEPPQPLVLHDL